MSLPHLDGKGEVHMVGISEKAVSARRAVASGKIRMSDEARRAIESHAVAKGDVLAVARIAAIQAAKRTSDWIPLCHPLALSGVFVEITPTEEKDGFRVKVEVETTGRTGAEMEALTAVTAGCLTIYDMAKALDKAMVIESVRLEEKTGGRSGDYRRLPDSPPAEAPAPQPKREWNCGVITLSDRARRGDYEDRSGPALSAEVRRILGKAPVLEALLPDDPDALASLLVEWSDERKLDFIVTTGGTGLSSRDRTPEATRKVLTTEVPGIMEHLRLKSAEVAPRAVWGRGVCGARGRTLILNLPGSPKAVKESMGFLGPLLEHALLSLRDEPDGHV